MQKAVVDPKTGRLVVREADEPAPASPLSEQAVPGVEAAAPEAEAASAAEEGA